VVRQHGALPATIAIIGGQCCIGLDAQQLEYIAQQGQKVRKVSRRCACMAACMQQHNHMQQQQQQQQAASAPSNNPIRQQQRRACGGEPCYV
jgi:hypothetical protein